MHADPNHPGLKKYREARARDKRRAIMRAEIRKNNPSLSDNQVEEIIKAQERAEKQGRIIKVGEKPKKNRKHKGRHSKKFKGRQESKSVKVEYVPNVRKIS